MFARCIGNEGSAWLAFTLKHFNGMLSFRTAGAPFRAGTSRAADFEMKGSGTQRAYFDGMMTLAGKHPSGPLQYDLPRLTS